MSAIRELQGKIACLESKVDQLESEIVYLDGILRRCGFAEGVITLKTTVEELLIEEAESPFPERPSSSDRS